MFTSKWCNENLNASPITWKAVKEEVIEVLESKSLVEVKEEIADVLYFAFCAIHKSTGISLPMIGAMPTIIKVINRLCIWEKIFNKHNLVFNKKYLVNGSNYNKKEKIEKALSLARAEQC